MKGTAVVLDKFPSTRTSAAAGVEYQKSAIRADPPRQTTMGGFRCLSERKVAQ